MEKRPYLCGQNASKLEGEKKIMEDLRKMPPVASDIATPKSPVAAITMARNDNLFLERWIDYYGNALGHDNLFILLDGDDQPKPRNTERVNIEVLPHKILGRAEGDKYRIGCLNALADKLFSEGYQAVIGSDADEFIIVDPQMGRSLREYILNLKSEGCASVSALGIDLAQNLRSEPEIDFSQSLLTSRQYGVLSSRYTKASILLKRGLKWGSGFHRIKGRQFYIAPSLYLIHTGYCDLKLIERRIADNSRLKGGWQRHLARRSRSIRYASKRKVHDGDKLFSRTRKLQSFFRQPHAINKPLMPTRALVVKLPQRFASIFI